MRRPAYVLVLAVALAASGAVAHVTPPVILVSDRDAVAGLVAGARRFFVREVRLSAGERQATQRQWGWTPQEDFHRFSIGRDERGRLVAAAIFMTEYTIHGPIRVAVGLEPDGRVRGATVIELSEETYPWLKPLLDRSFTREFVGRDSHGRFVAGEEPQGGQASPMGRFYAQVVASLIQRAAILYDVAVLGRAPAGQDR